MLRSFGSEHSAGKSFWSTLEVNTVKEQGMDYLEDIGVDYRTGKEEI